MKVIRPVSIDIDSQLLSTTAVETVSNYSAVASYSQGDRAISAHTIYESLQNVNMGNAPATSPTWWIEVGPDNRSACFDERVGTVTTGAAPLQMEVQPGRVNSMALIGVGSATSVEVSILSAPGGDSIYSKSIDMLLNQFVDWYGYFFDEYELRSEVVLTNLPAVSSMVVTVTIGAAGGTVTLGAMLFGWVYSIGTTIAPVTSSIADYSVKEVDEYGVATLVQRPFARRIGLSVLLPNGALNSVHRLLGALRATPTVWVPTSNERYGLLVVYGWYRDFSIDITYPEQSLCAIEIEGLT